MQDDILRLAYEVSTITREKIHLIDTLMRQARFLAINSHIVAAQAGAAGAAFGVLADEMGKVAGAITNISAELSAAIDASTERLRHTGEQLVLESKGARYTDLALNVIEIIDRNLYERSCDVRWWATDSAVVAAAEQGGEEALRHACARLGTILQSYTVYLDLCVVDVTGTVIACGRPEIYPNQIGGNVSQTPWFAAAMQTRSGNDYAAGEVRLVRDLKGAASATYATAIRAGGAPHGRIVGVLGISFDWAPQAAAVVKGVRLTEAERRHTRVMIIDANHRVLAASDDIGLLTESYRLDIAQPRGFCVKHGRLIAHALTPGYETYAGLGWYGVIESKLGEA